MSSPKKSSHRSISPSRRGSVESAVVMHAKSSSLAETINFEGYNHINANFEKRNLTNSNFVKAILQEANFSSAILNNVNFSSADLSNSNFTNAILVRANFTNANLTNANFNGADLTNANFKGAILEGATFEQADLTNVNLYGAYFGFNSYYALKEAKNYDQCIDRLDLMVESCVSTSTPPTFDHSILSCQSSSESKLLQRSEQSNPLNMTMKCPLLNNKKTKYYTHTYNPTTLKRKMEDMNLFPRLEETFDFTIRRNCCNCIAISLYYTNTQDLAKCDMYLASIRRTVDNVKKNLSDWIVRLYLDSSVYRSLMGYKQAGGTKFQFVEDSLDYLMNAENVEIYVYCCQDIMEGKTPIARTRTFRFLPLSDTDVNVRIIREADGIVTNVDCHNIRLFTQSDYLFYLPQVIPEYDFSLVSGGLSSYRSYSYWIGYYIRCLQFEYFETKQHLYDLLAGTLGVKLILKRKYYDEQSTVVQDLINRPINLTCSKNIRIPFKDSHKFQADDVVRNLNTGYDEILLLHIFRDYISCPIEIKGKFYEYTQLEVNSHIMSLILAAHNIKVYNVGPMDINEAILLTSFVTSLQDQGVLIPIDITAKLALYNATILSMFHSTPKASHSSFCCISSFLDSLLTSANINIDIPFDITFDNQVSLLSSLNIPFGANKAGEHINTALLPYYNCICDSTV